MNKSIFKRNIFLYSFFLINCGNLKNNIILDFFLYLFILKRKLGIRPKNIYPSFCGKKTIRIINFSEGTKIQGCCYCDKCKLVK